jgi:putative ABC transport system permease protein
MLKNYFRIAVRNLLRHKLHTAINVLGLAIGISACLTIFLLVNYEQNFDTFHPGKERIYRVYSQYSGLFDATNSGIAFPVPAAIRKECTGVEAVGHFLTLNNLDITIENKKQASKVFEEQKQVIAAEPDFFKVFESYTWLEGTPEGALTEPFKVVLTESRAKFYFGNIEPKEAIGREIAYNDSLRVTVSGIVADLKKQTDFTFTDFISFASVPQSWLKNDLGGEEGMKEWGSTTSASQVFIKLEKEVPTERMIKQFNQLITTYQKDKDPKLKLEYKLQPLADLRYSTIGIFNDSRAAAHRPTLNGLMLVAGLLLLIAAINFVNLATAQAVQRSKEVGVRKVLGGTRGVLVLQFLGETLVVTTVAVLLSILLAQGTIRFFHEFLPEGLHFNPIEPTMAIYCRYYFGSECVSGIVPGICIVCI